MNPNPVLIIVSDLCLSPHSNSRKVNPTSAVPTAAFHATAKEQEAF